jgi:hypothetical protein
MAARIIRKRGSPIETEHIDLPIAGNEICLESSHLPLAVAPRGPWDFNVDGRVLLFRSTEGTLVGCHVDEIAQLGSEKGASDEEGDGSVVWAFATQVFCFVHHVVPYERESVPRAAFGLAENPFGA